MVAVVATVGAAAAQAAPAAPAAPLSSGQVGCGLIANVSGPAMVQCWFSLCCFGSELVRLSGWFSYGSVCDGMLVDGSGLVQMWSTLANCCCRLVWPDVLRFSIGSAWFSKMVVAWVFLVQFSCVSMVQRWFTFGSAMAQLWFIVGAHGSRLMLYC